MISETSDLPEDIREQGHQTILSLINNYAESDEVRMAAITALPYTRPDTLSSTSWPFVPAGTPATRWSPTSTPC